MFGHCGTFKIIYIIPQKKFETLSFISLGDTELQKSLPVVGVAL